jgi:ribosome-associated toxin RatA of RatAB toxin-antitoxin module
MRYAKYALLYVGGWIGTWIISNGMQQGGGVDSTINFSLASVILIMTFAFFVEKLRSEIVNDVCSRLSDNRQHQS